jgi:flagellar hook-associated protein 3 FlgL
MGLRVTERGMHQAMLSNLQTSVQKLSKLQEQIASGKQINKPSDSPDGTVSALRYRGDLRRIEQYKRNAQDGLDWLNVSDTALQRGVEALNRARELSIQARNGALDAAAREGMAREVDALRETMLTLANTAVGDRPLFAGTASVASAYDANGVYQGTLPGTAGDRIERQLDRESAVRVNLTGPEAFGTPGADVFKNLADLADRLRTNPAALGTSMDELSGAQARLRSALATVGARSNQVNSMIERNEAMRLDATQGLADVESIDITEATLNVKLQEVAFQAALSAAAKVTRSSLMDFLG